MIADVSRALAEVLVPCGATALATIALALLARRLGWVDPGKADPARKRQSEAVPTVGGAAILIGCLAAELVSRPLASGAVLGAWFAAADARWVGLALALGFCVGWIDDRRPGGLSAVAKAWGQAIAGLALALSLPESEATGAHLVLVPLLALLAQNAVNTFDNADGAATGLALVGLAPGAGPWAAAAAGFLPFNLWLRRVPGRGPEGTPRAYLGDAGSHLLGLLLLVSPVGWAVLVLPLVDLARLAFVRLARGSRPWIGDRRHLAHRLIAAGCTRTLVVLLLAAVAVPPVLAVVVRPGLDAFALGAGVTLALFAVLLRATPALD